MMSRSNSDAASPAHETTNVAFMCLFTVWAADAGRTPAATAFLKLLNLPPE